MKSNTEKMCMEHTGTNIKFNKNAKKMGVAKWIEELVHRRE